MIVQLRICVPAALSGTVVDLCMGHAGSAEIAVFRGSSVVPAGDVITVQLARESVEGLMEELHGLRVPELGSVSASTPELVLSERADKASKEVPGEGSDAVIWDEVSRQTGEDSRLTWSYLAFLVIATQLAGIGIVTNSAIAIVGAMVVGPEFGPLAALALGLVERKWAMVRAAAVALAVGFPVAMLVTAAAAWISIPLGLYPRDVLDHGQAVEFIYHPGPYSLIVAALAGAAGMLSMTSHRSSALIGVFISVTTVPAAGYIGVALVLGEAGKAAGSAVQLFLNLLGIVVAAAAVLLFLKFAQRRGEAKRALSKTPAARARPGAPRPPRR
ncbi:DUF389 domain-containing protein [Arthrobacter celericrescens]|uniref:DUF389 domain-containing protein n=1 Tax=Arthrobacter celericrescens TaxID=2320851 RepID=UPI000EA21735|nr:DUF389 domain-containing protein [Arthrobacter celericrescens]